MQSREKQRFDASHTYLNRIYSSLIVMFVVSHNIRLIRNGASRADLLLLFSELIAVCSENPYVTSLSAVVSEGVTTTSSFISTFSKAVLMTGYFLRNPFSFSVGYFLSQASEHLFYRISSSRSNNPPRLTGQAPETSFRDEMLAAAQIGSRIATAHVETRIDGLTQTSWDTWRNAKWNAITITIANYVSWVSPPAYQRHVANPPVPVANPTVPEVTTEVDFSPLEKLKKDVEAKGGKLHLYKGDGNKQRVPCDLSGAEAHISTGGTVKAKTHLPPFYKTRGGVRGGLGVNSPIKGKQIFHANSLPTKSVPVPPMAAPVSPASTSVPILPMAAAVSPASTSATTINLNILNPFLTSQFSTSQSQHRANPHNPHGVTQQNLFLQSTRLKPVRHRYELALLALNELETAIKHYSMTTPSVRNGLFAGKLPRNLREMNRLFQRVKSNERSIREDLEAIANMAKGMGHQHPILIAANKCKGVIEKRDQYKTITRQTMSR